MSIHPTIKSGLVQRMGLFSSRCLLVWDSISQILDELGTKERKQGEWHTTITHELVFTYCTSHWQILKSNYAMGDDYINLIVDNETVLRIDRYPSSFRKPKTVIEKITSVLEGEYIYFVRAYVSGLWEEQLDFATISAVVGGEKAKAEAALREKQKKAEFDRLYTDEEKNLAQKFGLLIY